MMSVVAGDPIGQVRRLSPGEAAEALDILCEAARWSARFGAPIWDADSFTLAEHEELARADELWGGFEGEQMCACCRLQARDALFWPDDPAGEALYLHKLAVRRRAAGRGWSRRLIESACGQARSAGARALRLDTTVASGLVELYRGLGFRLVGVSPVRLGDDTFVLLERPV